MAFFEFNQNNSGGSFDVEVARGIGHYVIVEALDARHANDRAEEIGLYFGGVEDGIDCECCGNRWDSAWGEGDEVPSIYGEPVAEYMADPEHASWRDTAFVHYLDGRVVLHGRVA